MRSRGHKCLQYIRSWILEHAERSPAARVLEIDRPSLAEMYTLYKADNLSADPVAEKTFLNLWYRQLRSHLPDPATSIRFEVRIRRRRAVGFNMCDTCEMHKLCIRMATGPGERAAARKKQQLHINAIREDRTELARIRSECRHGKTKVGFAIDAGDTRKFLIPTTQSTAKTLAGLHRIKSKLTAVEFFNEARDLLLFRTLPTIKTGNHTHTHIHNPNPNPNTNTRRCESHTHRVDAIVQLGVLRPGHRYLHQLGRGTRQR